MNGLLDQVLARQRLKSGFKSNSSEACVGPDTPWQEEEKSPIKQVSTVDTFTNTDITLLDELIKK